jgi:hypothetical protein
VYLVDTNVWVSFDADFDRTERGRKTPADVLKQEPERRWGKGIGRKTVVPVFLFSPCHAREDRGACKELM